MKTPSVLGIVSYRVFPAEMGGQKAIAELYGSLAKFTGVTILASRENRETVSDRSDRLQRPDRSALLEALIERVGLFHGVGIGDHNRVDRGPVLVEGVDAAQVLFDERAAGEAPGFHRRMNLRDCGLMNFKRRRRLLHSAEGDGGGRCRGTGREQNEWN